MDPKLIAEALDALTAGDADKAAEILKKLIASAAGGGAPVVDDETFTDPPVDDEDKPAVVAAMTKLTRITGKETVAEAVEEVEVWHQSHVELEKRSAELAREREALEANERDSLTARVSKCLTPGVAWANPVEATERSKRKPAEPYASMKLPELRKHVAALEAAKLGGSKGGPSVQPPTSNDDTTLPELTPKQLELCKKRGIDPEKARAEFAKTRKAISERSAARVPASDG